MYSGGEAQQPSAADRRRALDLQNDAQNQSEQIEALNGQQGRAYQEVEDRTSDNTTARNRYEALRSEARSAETERTSYERQIQDLRNQLDTIISRYNSTNDLARFYREFYAWKVEINREIAAIEAACEQRNADPELARLLHAAMVLFSAAVAGLPHPSASMALSMTKYLQPRERVEPDFLGQEAQAKSQAGEVAAQQQRINQMDQDNYPDRRAARVGHERNEAAHKVTETERRRTAARRRYEELRTDVEQARRELGRIENQQRDIQRRNIT